MPGGNKPEAQIVELDAARARKQLTTPEHDALSIEQIENAALLLLAAEAVMLCNPARGDTALHQVAQSTHVVLCRVMDIIAQSQDNLGAPIPELLDNRLECLSVQDPERGSFGRVIDQYYGGDIDQALAILRRLRRIDADLGLPCTAEPEQWSEAERLQAITWLRCVEHVQEVAVTLDWPPS